jgi:hypothetical protein
VQAVECGAGRLSEGAPTSLTSVAALFLAVDHDVLFTFASVSAALVARNPLSFNSTPIHGCVGYYPKSWAAEVSIKGRYWTIAAGRSAVT